MNGQTGSDSSSIIEGISSCGDFADFYNLLAKWHLSKQFCNPGEKLGMSADIMVGDLTKEEMGQLKNARPHINNECAFTLWKSLDKMEKDSELVAVSNTIHSTADEIEKVLAAVPSGVAITANCAWTRSIPDIGYSEMASYSPGSGTKVSMPEPVATTEKSVEPDLWDMLGCEAAIERANDSICDLLRLYKTNPIEYPLARNMRMHLKEDNDADRVFGKYKDELIALFTKVSEAPPPDVTNTPNPGSAVDTREHLGEDLHQLAAGDQELSAKSSTS